MFRYHFSEPHISAAVRLVGYSEFLGCLSGRCFDVEVVEYVKVSPELMQAVIRLAMPAFQPLVMQSVQAIFATVKALFAVQMLSDTFFAIMRVYFGAEVYQSPKLIILLKNRRN